MPVLFVIQDLPGASQVMGEGTLTGRITYLDPRAGPQMVRSSYQPFIDRFQSDWHAAS
jgi:hypothetical protein